MIRAVWAIELLLGREHSEEDSSNQGNAVCHMLFMDGFKFEQSLAGLSVLQRS